MATAAASGLAAIKGGLDRLDRLDRPDDRRAAAPDTTTPSVFASSATPAVSASNNGAVPHPSSTDAQARPGTPSAAESAAATPPVRRTSRLSRGSSALALKDSESARPQQGTAPSVPSSSASANASIDPLSKHIFLRTNTDLSKSSKLRSYPPAPDSPVPDVPSPTIDSPNRFSSPSADVGREKRKSFLGRLSMRTSKKKDDASDNASEFGEPRTEGSNAHVFSCVVDSAGFIPHHKEPPRYIRVKLHNKKVKEFDRMFLAQELVGTRPPEKPTDGRLPVVTMTAAGRKKTMTGGAIWTTEFSKDGKYLAAGGRDHVVRVWQVIANAEDRHAQEKEEALNGGGDGERLSAPVFLEKPIQEFTGHTGEVLNLSWSKNNFLLSTSMDKTVRLWHVSRQECLCTFKHKELVSKVAFHPKDDRFFLAGSLDATLRLWSIPDKTIAFSAQLSDMITAVAFSPDGKMAIAGLLNGYCYLLETDGLKPLTQIHVRSSRGRNAKGSKITGIASMVLPNARPNEAIILVTSTDARVRIYNLRDKTLDCKFKGHEHASTQLSANFSDNGRYVICGSESQKVFIWTASHSDAVTKDKYPCETFDAHRGIVTTAIFAPTKTRQLLGGSDDPIYDLCNPPPITLMSLEETLASQAGTSNHTLHHDGASATAAASPALSTPPVGLPQVRIKPEESPAYIARSTHYDGNIIVTSDDTGIIKVFRQDCAANKRRHDSWEAGSGFGRKLGANTSLVGRSGSIITRTSASSAAHSRRGSLSLPPHHPSHAAGAGGTPPFCGHNNSDRINSWRHAIEGGSNNNSRPGSLVGTGSGAGGAYSVRTERSISPSKSTRAPVGMLGGLGSDPRRQPYAATTSSPLSTHFAISHTGHGRANVPTSAPSALSAANAATNTATSVSQPEKSAAAAPAIPGRDSRDGAVTMTDAAQASILRELRAREDEADRHDKDEVNNAHVVPARSSMGDGDETPPLDAGGANLGFWNLNRWKNIAGLRTPFGSITGGTGGTSGTGGGGTGGSASTGHSSGHMHNPFHLHGHEHAHHGEASDKDKDDKDGKDDKDNKDATQAGAMAEGDGSGNASGITSGNVSGSEGPASAVTGERRTQQKSSGTLSPQVTSGTQSPSMHLHLPGTGPTSVAHSQYARSGSLVSRLSSEMTSSDGETDSDEMRCTKCGGREFKARRVNNMQRLQCSRCGKIVEEDV